MLQNSYMEDNRMYICPNCNKQSEVPANFCTSCGTPMVMAPDVQTPAQAAYQAPAPVQPQYYQPTCNYPQQPKAPSKGKAVTGMALGIAGLVFSVLGFFYLMLFSAAGLAEEAGVVLSFACGFFGFPLSLVSMILSNSSRSNGDTTVFSKLGKIFGLIGVILSGLLLLIGFTGIGNL